jgi:hypothetical protein
MTTWTHAMLRTHVIALTITSANATTVLIAILACSYTLHIL